MREKRKRKSITYKIINQVLKQDNYTCKSCGRSPVTHPGLSLEIDHVIPFSLGGLDELSNYQIRCLSCNRGKGNNEHLNRTVKNELDIILNWINPKILKDLGQKKVVSVVANQEDYVKVTEKNSYDNFYEISPSTNTIFGANAGKNLGIYTQHDNRGSKVHFFISKLGSA